MVLDLDLRRLASDHLEWGSWTVRLRNRVSSVASMPAGGPSLVGGPPVEDVLPRKTVATVAAVFGELEIRAR